MIYTVTLSSGASPWFSAALNRINRLTALAAGWNSYSGQEVKADTVIEAIEFLTRVAYPGMAAPAIVPLADGGLQVEWHRGGLDIEVTFSDRESAIYVEDRDDGSELELPLAAAPRIIAERHARLSEL
jgi:hypothetical protein